MTKTIRRNQQDFFIITGERNIYGVALERKTNDINGNPRWRALVAVLAEKGEEEPAKDGSRYNAVYDFGGHYYNALGEARWIVARYESEGRQ